MDIISAYQQVGSYRAAADLCGTTHKTVRRVVEKAEAGETKSSACQLQDHRAAGRPRGGRHIDE
jgi:hypothetical protein